jgi:hypothetical protein
MPAKSKSYEFVDINVRKAHIWSSVTESVYKRSNLILNLKTTAGQHFLIKCESLSERDEIAKILMNGIEDEVLCY